MKDSIRTAIIQAKPYPSFDDPRNIGHALQLMEKCRGEDLDIICLPEYFPFTGERELGAAARKFNSYVIAGLLEEEGGKRYNTATLFNRAERSSAGNENSTWVRWSAKDLESHEGTGYFGFSPPILEKSACRSASISGDSPKPGGNWRTRGSMWFSIPASSQSFAVTGDRDRW